jgi:hypothetical protein
MVDDTTKWKNVAAMHAACSKVKDSHYLCFTRNLSSLAQFRGVIWVNY